MQTKAFRFGPQLMSAGIGDYLNPGILVLGVGVLGPGYVFQRVILNHIRVVNRSAVTVNVSLWIGAPGVGAAGTEFAWSQVPIPPNGVLDWPGRMAIDASEFLTGQASAANALVIQGEGEIFAG